MYEGEDKVMAYLADGKPRPLEEISSATGLHPDSVRRILEDLQTRGFIAISKFPVEALAPSEELRGYAFGGRDKFPEYQVFKKALAGSSVAALSPEEKSFGLPWAKQKGYIQIENGKLKPLKEENEVLTQMQTLVDVWNKLQSGHPVLDPKILDELVRRKWIVKKTSQRIQVQITARPYVAQSGFDISASAQNAPLGKAHPLGVLSEKIRTIFTEMGFEEMEGDLVQSAFWNFDALFQPQDHPARDLADTFYVKGEARLPDDRLVQRVKRAHETGWKYKWSETEARRRVLRTHTTALSARYLAELKDGNPRKYFTIGKVFRNEATDFKHLTEFYQVEGIVSWEHATFSDLLGILKEFYRKLGFEKIRFRPSFFPYTEPSLEIEVYFEPRKEWLELGGAGIFRPEVSIPLANRYPVLAWGLSLERPLLLTMGLEDIRKLYRNEMDFLKEARVPL